MLQTEKTTLSRTKVYLLELNCIKSQNLVEESFKFGRGYPTLCYKLVQGFWVTCLLTGQYNTILKVVKSSIMIDELNLWRLEKNKNTTLVNILLFLKKVSDFRSKDIGEEA